MNTETVNSKAPPQQASAQSNIGNLVAQFNLALFEMQRELPVIEKNTQGYGYKYADLDAVMEAIKPLLVKYKLFLVHKTLYVGERYVLRTFLRHTNGLEEFSDWAMPVKNENDPQAFGASETYGRRYNIAKLLNIITDEDVDGATPNKTPKAAAKNDVKKSYKADPTKKISEKQLELLKKIMEQRKISADEVKAFGRDNFEQENPKAWSQADFQHWMDFVNAK